MHLPSKLNNDDILQLAFPLVCIKINLVFWKTDETDEGDDYDDESKTK